MKEILKMARELVSKLEVLDATADNKIQLSELKAGDEFRNELGVFIVLDQSDGQTKVCMKEFYKDDVKFDSNSPDYKTSELRELFDTEILAAFEKAFGAENIIEHAVSLTTVDMQTDFGSIECKVRPVTFDESRQYNDLLVNEELPGYYWTLTPWSTKERGWEYSVAVVSPAGDFYYDICCNYFGVRPFCILNSNIFVSKED